MLAAIFSIGSPSLYSFTFSKKPFPYSGTTPGTLAKASIPLQFEKFKLLIRLDWIQKNQTQSNIPVKECVCNIFAVHNVIENINTGNGCLFTGLLQNWILLTAKREKSLLIVNGMNFLFHNKDWCTYTCLSTSVSAKATPRSKALHKKYLKETIFVLAVFFFVSFQLLRKNDTYESKNPQFIWFGTRCVPYSLIMQKNGKKVN